MLTVKIILTYIISILIGVISISIGNLVWKKKRLSIITGFDEATFQGDKEAFGKLLGQFTIYFGIGLISLPFGLQFIGTWYGIIFGALVFFTIMYVLLKLMKISKGEI